MENNQDDQPLKTPESKPPGIKLNMLDFILTFLSPLIVGKSLVVYFGTMYSAYPGRGYGYALMASIAFTLGTLARFLWKYRHYDDE